MSITSNIAKLMSGGVIVVIVNIISYPILTSVYSPLEYGVFSLFLYTAMIFSSVSLGRMELIIPSIDNEEDKKSVFSTAINNLFIISALGFIILSTYDLYNDGSLLKAFLLFVTVFFNGLNSLVLSLHLNKSNYKGYNLTVIIQVFLCVFLQVIFYYSFDGWVGLILGYIFSFFFSVFVVNYSFLLMNVRKYYYFSFNGYLKTLKKRKESWLPNSFQSLLNISSMYFLVQAVNYIGGPTQVGLFSLCHKILVIPVRLFGNSTKQVLLRELSLPENRKSSIMILLKITIALLLVSAIVFSLFLYLAPFLFQFIFSDEWNDALLFMAPISYWLALTVVYTPVIAYLNILGDVRIHLYYEIFNFISRASVLFLIIFLSLDVNAIDFVLYTSLLSSIIIILFIAYSFYHFKKIKRHL